MNSRTVFADYRRIPSTMDAISDYIYSTCAYIVANGKSVWVTKDIVGAEIVYDIHPATKANTFGGISWRVGEQEINLGKQLATVRDKITYDRMDFLPGLTVQITDRVFNSFAGYIHKVRPEADLAGIEPILYHRCIRLPTGLLCAYCTVSTAAHGYRVDRPLKARHRQKHSS